MPLAARRALTDPQSQTALVAAGAAVLAFAARIHGALNYAFWQDEVASAIAITKSTPLGVARQVAGNESTPPGWYEMGWALHRLGVPVVDVRVVSVVAGALLAGLTVVLARRVTTLWGAALAGVFVALGYQFVFHGSELRAYELFALMCVVWVLALMSAASQPSSGRLVALGTCVAVGSMTHYFFLIALAVGLAWLWAAPIRPPVRRKLLVATGLGLVPLALWTPALAVQIRHDRYADAARFSWSGLLHVYWHFYATYAPDWRFKILLVALVPVVTAAGAVIVWRTGPLGRLVAGLSAASVLAAAVAGVLGDNVFDVRNLIGAAPFASICIAAAIARIPRLGAWVVGALAVVSVGVGYAHDNGTPPFQYDRVAAMLLRESWRPGDPILVPGHAGYSFAAPLRWYLGRPQPFLVGHLGRGACATVFLVMPQNEVRRLVPGPVASAGEVGHDVVLRDSGGTPIRAALGIDPAVLWSTRQPCVGSA